MASVVRRIRRSIAAGGGFRKTSRLRGRWAREVCLPTLELRYEARGGLTRDEYKFYLRRSADIARWEAEAARVRGGAS